MVLNYSSKHDISYVKYNNENIPWKLNSSYISHNNQRTHASLNLGTINNSLVIESSQNNIVLATPQTKKVSVKNNISVINNLDVLNNLNTKIINANNMSISGILTLTAQESTSSVFNIIGKIILDGKLKVGGSEKDVSASESQFRNVNFIDRSVFYDVSINNSNIYYVDFSYDNIISSYISNSVIGYDKSNNIVRNKAVFSTVSMESLTFDGSLTSQNYIKFPNNSNANNPIIIKSSDDYSKLEINKPLIVGPKQINTNISNISIFNGDISCNILHYSQLNPDVRLNKYFDISNGHVSLSGNSIPTSNIKFDIGSTNYKFNEIISTNYVGNLSGQAISANDLRKNLDMSFNNLDIYGTITLNRQNLNQFLSGDLLSINAAIIDFSNENKSVRDLSASLYSRAGFDLCLNTHFTKISLRDDSFVALNNNITSISASVYSKSDFDLCLNRNVLRNNDVSAIVAVVTNPTQIYPTLGYINSSLNKVTNAKVSNELVFPYAITYVDDVTEDTNIKESYMIKEIRNKATTTITTKETVIYTRTWNTTGVNNPTNITLDRQPDNASHLYVTMQSIRENTGVSYRRKWYDVDSNATAYTVFRKITTAHTITVNDSFPTTRFEVDSGLDTWANHNSKNTASRSLAIITTSAQHELVRTAIAAHNPNTAYFIGATSTRSWLKASGGTITADSNYVYHTFTSNGTFSANFYGRISALLVGGGGSGARAPSFSSAGGGGGGGGVIQITERYVDHEDFDIVVGNGGRGSINENGSDTTAFGAVAAGGGRGRADSGNGFNGGCGGGVSSSNQLLTGGIGSGNLTGDSNNVATGYYGNGGNITTVTNNPIRGSGGGGAGGNAPDINTSSIGVNDTGATGSGAGGMGVSSSIPMTTLFWGGGGGGAVRPQSGVVAPRGGYGGKGGGGGGAGDPFGGPGGGSSLTTGGNGGSYYDGGNGAPNTGGGGGGCLQFGTPGSGGSGIVIVRYEIASLETRKNDWKWHNNTNVDTSIANWTDGRPLLGTRAAMRPSGLWYDYSETDRVLAVFKNTNYIGTTEQNVPASDVLVSDNTLRTWEGHRDWASSNSNTNSSQSSPYITYKLVSITNASTGVTSQNTVANFAEQAGFDTIFIGAKRKTGSNASGRTSNDWEWIDGTNWSYENFSNGFERTIDNWTYTTSYTENNVPTRTNRPADTSSNTSSAVYNSETSISQNNVKLPLLVSSNTGSIVATSTAVSVNSLPLSVTPIYRDPAYDADNRPVTGFRPNDPDNTSSNGNSVVTKPYTYDTNLRYSTANEGFNNFTDTYEYIRTYKYTYDTYSYVNSYYDTSNGLITGSFKISDNSNNRLNYISPLVNTTIPTSYSCIAVTNDGMFVALGKASEVTVYMKTSTGWIPIGSAISVNFSAYTETSVGIIPTQFTDNWRKNLQNLAINFNYFTGLTTSQLLLAFGDTRNIIKVYSYSGGSWSSSNGLYSVGGGSWGTTFLRRYNATTAEINNNNFGYFVTLSQSPSVLGFTVANKFYTYNCTNSDSDSSQRGSLQTLPNSYNGYTNIIAFKMSSDAEKIIVSNTYYVFIYKWNINDWTLITNAIINLVSAAITFTYPNTSTTPIPAGPRSLDISNISTNECVFAIGFPDVLIDISANRKSRGYVEYWKLTNTTFTRLATLVPRKRNIDNSNVDTDEYFFSAGGIKITNANTILVAPNFKFHFNNNKNYTLDTSNVNWTTHNNNARNVSGREMASIENEADNELVKISARNNVVWIGATKISNNISTGITSTHWRWSDLSSSWYYTSFASGQPNNSSETRIQSASGSWYDTDTSTTSKAVYMTKLQYSLNTFSIFDKFYFHSSGFSSSYANTDISSTVIAKWMTNDTQNRSIDFKANGSIVSNGKGIFTISDIRLKENIVDSTPKLEDLLKVRVVNYNLKGCKDNKLIGVVAQELEQLFPTLVNDGELSMHDIYLGKTESYKSVKYSCFDVILIKAFQEHMAIINKLTSQLDEIESKTKLLKAINKDFFILKQELDLLKSENELFKLTINEILKLI